MALLKEHMRSFRTAYKGYYVKFILEKKSSKINDLCFGSGAIAYIIYYVKFNSRRLQPEESFFAFWQIRG